MFGVPRKSQGEPTACDLVCQLTCTGTHTSWLVTDLLESVLNTWDVAFGCTAVGSPLQAPIGCQLTCSYTYITVSQCLTHCNLYSIQCDSSTCCQESAMGCPLLVHFEQGRLHCRTNLLRPLNNWNAASYTLLPLLCNGTSRSRTRLVAAKTWDTTWRVLNTLACSCGKASQITNIEEQKESQTQEGKQGDSCKRKSRMTTAEEKAQVQVQMNKNKACLWSRQSACKAIGPEVQAGSSGSMLCNTASNDFHITGFSKWYYLTVCHICQCLQSGLFLW